MGTNDITGDRQVTKAATDEYRHNYDRIFKKDPILPGQVDPFDSVWNQWIHYSKRFKPTNNEFARWFFDAGVNHQKNVSSSGR